MSLNRTHRRAKYLARTLYDGTGAHPRHDVFIEVQDGRFERVETFRHAHFGPDVQELEVATPGLIDIQINGANDVQFNSAVTAQAISEIANGAAKGGTAWILPTFVTAHGQGYSTAIAAAKTAMESGVPGILGVHLEGPFLSKRRPGIHPREAIRVVTDADMECLLQPFPGRILMTLAPEEQRAGTIKRLSSAGIVVFAGHSDASFADMSAAQAEGLRGVTHLFNAMSQLQGREPGIVGSVLAGNLFAGIIADGHHVHWSNVALAVRSCPDHLCLVTDAMCTLAGNLKEFDFFEERIFLRDGKLTNADGTLAGAHIAMDASIRNLIDKAIASPEQAIKMASRNPAAALGLDGTLGLVKEGLRASLSHFDRDFAAVEVVR